MEENVIYLDKEGYEEHLKSIDNLLINLGRIEENMNELKSKDFDKEKYEELLDLKDGIKERILKKRSLKVIIVEKKTEDSIVDIGDRVRINICFTETNKDEKILELITGESDFAGEIMKASINSPIGKALYGAKVGETTTYPLADKQIKVEILEKINVKKLTKENK